MRHLLSLFMLGVTVAAYAQYEGPLQPLQGIEYKAEAQASVSDGTTPLWLNANKYGLSSLEKTNGYLRGAVIRPLGWIPPESGVWATEWMWLPPIIIRANPLCSRLLWKAAGCMERYPLAAKNIRWN